MKTIKKRGASAAINNIAQADWDALAATEDIESKL